VPEFLVTDPFSAFFLICFFVGVIFVLASAALGATQDFLHLPGFHHGHMGDVGGAGHGAAHAGGFGHGSVGDVGHGHAGVGHATGFGAHAHAAGFGHPHADGSVNGHSDAGRPTTSASPLNLMTLMAFLTWFGGAGYVLYAVYGLFLPLSLLAAVAAGALAGWLVFLFLAKVLLPGTVAGDLRAQSLIGTVARVSIPIPQGRVGEIVYTLEGARHSDGARSVDGRPLGRDKEVVIIRFERGIAYVEEWDQFRDEIEGLPPSGGQLPSGQDGRSSAPPADGERD
jgi:membrane protein implicated in regulation of membrane protease activity